MPTGTQDRQFAETMRDSVDEIKMSSSTLDNAIDWISSNLNPDDVFSESDLEKWAEDHGFVAKED